MVLGKRHAKLKIPANELNDPKKIVLKQLVIRCKNTQNSLVFKGGSFKLMLGFDSIKTAENER